MATGDVQRGPAEERLKPTIFALSSGAGPSGIAVVRVAGPRSFEMLERLTRRPLPPVRELTARRLVDPAGGEHLDHALVVRFAAPASVTGDDLVELHLHGGVATVAAVLATLAASGLALAEPGAFTRRAFDNGKLDLTQVEALADLLAAETEGQRRAALFRTGTGLVRHVDRWRAVTLAARADLEATLDFAEEDEVPAVLSPARRETLTRMSAELSALAADCARGERLQHGVLVAIVGATNTGKSSLLNALARRDAALVSPLPGTTRDVVEVRLVVAGVPVTLIDTAGRRTTDDVLEAEGIRRGIARAGEADIVIDLDGAIGAAIPVRSMSDVRGVAAGWHGGVLDLSAVTGDGLAALDACLERRIAALVRPHEPPPVAAARQAAALERAAAAVGAAWSAADPVIAAEELRRVALALDELVGRSRPDVVLDTIFARFCIGK